MSQANVGKKDGNIAGGESTQEDGKNTSRMDLIKPSMMSVTESRTGIEEEGEEGDAAGNGGKRSVFGISAFKAT